MFVRANPLLALLVLSRLALLDSPHELLQKLALSIGAPRGAWYNSTLGRVRLIAYGSVHGANYLYFLLVLAYALEVLLCLWRKRKTKAIVCPVFSLVFSWGK